MYVATCFAAAIFIIITCHWEKGSITKHNPQVMNGLPLACLLILSNWLLKNVTVDCNTSLWLAQYSTTLTVGVHKKVFIQHSRKPHGILRSILVSKIFPGIHGQASMLKIWHMSLPSFCLIFLINFVKPMSQSKKYGLWYKRHMCWLLTYIPHVRDLTPLTEDGGHVTLNRMLDGTEFWNGKDYNFINTQRIRLGTSEKL